MKMHGDGTPNNSDRSNADDNHDSNPFVRFKHHVDANIHAGINTLTGLSRSRTSSGGDDHVAGTTTTTTTGSGTMTPNTTTNTNNLNDSLSLARSLGLLSPQDHHFEARLTSLTSSSPNGASTLPQASAAWRLFLLRSAYSPLRLEYDWQSSSPSSLSSSTTSPWRHVPTPRDLPQGCEAGEVGWLEAFEDLLRASSGLPLTDLRERVAENRRVWGRFGLGLDGIGFPFFSPGSLFGGSDGPFGFLFGGTDGDRWGWDRLDRWDGKDEWPWGWHLQHRHDRHPGSLARAMGLGLGMGGEGVRAASWLNRMEEQGLNEVLFPVCDPVRGYQSPRTVQEWTERRQAEASRQKETESLWEELMQDVKQTSTETHVKEVDAETQREREAAEEGRRRLRRELESWWDAGQDTATSFFDGIGGFVRMLGKVLEDEARSLQQFGKPDKDSKDNKNAPEKDKSSGPETETDLYTLIQSTFHDSERSLSNLFKTLSEGWHNAFNTHQPKPASPPKTETTESFDKATGLTKKTTKTEYVDDRGNNHAKTETTWTDESGKVVMRQVHSSVGRAERWGVSSPSRRDAIKNVDGVEGDETQQQHQQHQQHQQQLEEKTDTAGEEKQQQKKDGGWFWK
ncbi:hypothetical protein VTJ49DRAFT_2173 [Mycothermus thermophilus]|uniref:Uncharacterized protein n=1 Tax=Humicola insolens TaxID=85995 RepID=A0ABR3VAP1_HUMIN